MELDVRKVVHEPDGGDKVRRGGFPWCGQFGDHTCMKPSSLLFTTMLAALLVAGPAFASRAGGTATIALAPLYFGLSNPVAITNAHDGSGRLFITAPGRARDDPRRLQRTA